MLELADLVPEATGAGNFVHGSMSRLKLVVTGPGGGLSPSTPIAIELQRRLDKFNLGRAGELMFFSGECFVLWPTLGDPEVLSIDEIKTNCDPMEVKGANGKFVPLQSSVQVIRIWRESKRNRYHATSAHKSLMDLLESMYVHQLGDMAVAHSRLISAGILVWPTARKRQGLDPETGLPIPGSQEELVEDFSSTAKQALNSQSGLEAKIPFVFMVDNALDAANAVPQMVSLEREDYADQYSTRYESYRIRYGSAIDLPVEQTTGMGATNHWSAQQIDEQTATTYVIPRAQEIVDALVARVASNFELGIAIDARDLIAKPDITTVVMQLAALGIVKPESIRKALLSGNIEDLVMQDPITTPANPEVNARGGAGSASRASNAPSDFQVNGSRGGGQFRAGN